MSHKPVATHSIRLTALLEQSTSFCETLLIQYVLEGGVFSPARSTQIAAILIINISTCSGAISIQMLAVEAICSR